MKDLFITFLSILVFATCTQKRSSIHAGITLIANGHMPAITKDDSQVIHLVYGTGDSIMYTFSNSKGDFFSSPQLIDTLEGLVAYATRGPQIAATHKGIAVIAVNKSGNIYSYIKNPGGLWVKTQKVNDADTTDKEGFLGLASDNGNNLFAIWTDLRNNHRNKIFGARSVDGGKTWRKNIRLYASPDGTVCECCKPSVVMKKNYVFVMFRNFLNGNRDLYLTQSTNAGETFGEARKLGKGNWALNGCPMDGGGLALNDKDYVQTVWRRQSKIYSCEPGKEEKVIGKGKGCSIETIHDKTVYAWSDKNDIICLLPDGSSKMIGKGSLPLIKSVSEHEIVCIWENDGRIERYVLHF